ncbi:MAG TPA: ArsA-related P-loop ATPase [Thermoanaerobaculia bacterium]|nr:ArsA-related P-loop ATPase [Thermoanaerobaculia bacterium]
MELIARLARLQLVVVTGKGGVGKTAVAAALGLALAAAGRRVLVLEVDPRENVHQMLGVPPSGGEIVPARPGVWVQNLKPGQVLDQIVRERLRVQLLLRRVLASPIYEQFSAGAPGLKELAILGHALRLLRGAGAAAGVPPPPPIDLVVLDAPATGHGVRLLSAPALVSEVIRGGPFGALAGELARFIADPGRCGIVVVTQAEEMPVEEALELRQALARQLDREPEALIVNGLFPPFPPERAAEARAGAPPARPADQTAAALAAAPPEAEEAAAADGDDLRTLWRDRRALNERELARLAAAWSGPRIELPLLPLGRGPALADALRKRLAGIDPAAGETEGRNVGGSGGGGEGGWT